MLEIFKGKSTKSYENVFFRKISEELSQIFKQKNWNGILLGMPVCNSRDDLQIDCLLVTEQQIILIDLKNYCGTLELPSEGSFKHGKWVMSNGEIVKGGSSLNPYIQIGKQRRKLNELLGRRLHNFDKKTVSTIVCFHEKTQIIGAIPRKDQIGFSIADATNYHHKIVDIIDVVDSENKNYLSENGRRVLLETLFTAASYEFDVQIEEVIEQSLVATSVVSENYKQQINGYLTSDSRVMILTGNTKSGKTSLIPTIREEAFNCHFTDVPVFAYSNRIRERMLESNPHLEEVESLYGEIFDFSLETVDQFYKKSIPLKERDEGLDEEKMLYIIDDSQLITNSSFDTELLQFGSGQLLDDILQYIDLKSHPKSKIIFIGDKNKLSYGSKIENALNPEYLKSLLELKELNTKVFEMELLPDKEKHSEIIDVCNNIAKSIQKERYNHLLIHTTGEVASCKKGQERELLERAYTNPQANKILVFSNNQASQVNQWIKKYIIQNGNDISVKDYVLFNATINAYAPSLHSQHVSPFDQRATAFSFVEPKRINNGHFGEVVSTHYANTVEHVLEVNGTKVSLKYIPCHIKLQDGSIVETYIFDNYLQAEKNELNKNELIAYQMLLARYEKDLLAQEPFEKSPEFAQMRASNDYIKLEVDSKVNYRKASDKRKLTEFEKNYRRRVLKKLNQPDSEYFRLFNAARVKFGWAMTVNKAMVYSFENVYFNVKQGEHNGRTNKEYFKWLYTGISTALGKVQLINWEPITPFLKTEFQKNASQNTPTKKGNMLLLSNEGTVAQQLQPYLEMKLANIATILNIDSKSYLEIVTLEVESRKIEVFFDYNNNGIKLPRRKSGDVHDFEKIVELLKMTSQELPEEIGEIKSYLEELTLILLKQNIKMTVLKFSEWNVCLNFRKQKYELDIQLWYNGDNMITKFNYLKGEENLFVEIVDVIHEFYGIK